MPDLPTGTVTFLFSDIEGSTRLAEATGSRFAALLARHQEILRSSWREHGGIEIGTEGDSFFVVFTDAVAAVAAAARAQQQLAAEPWPSPTRVRVRIGIHTGRAVLGGDNYVGLDVHRAARIASAGHGGQVLLSDATRRLVERDLPAGVSLRDLGPHRLRDLTDPEQISQLTLPGLEDRFPAIRSLDARPTNLPPQQTPLLGREADIDRIRALLDLARLVTLTGPGGIGKTRLALAAAESVRHRFPDGVFVAWLAPLNEGTALPSAIAGPLGVQESGDRPAREVLVEHLRDRNVLLVLDNFEHLATEAAYLAGLLEAAPALRLMVTSQTVLRLAAEHVHEVRPLGVPDRSASHEEIVASPAVALFVDRVRAFKPSFVVAPEGADDVAELVARLDGVPLAIELAAARMRVLTPKAILARLDQRLALLTGGGADRPARHQTLRAALDWSYELLHERSREMLGRLSVFRGGFDFEAAEALAAIEPPIDAADQLAVLVEHSLVRSDDVGGEPRFALLEAIREYAAERLAVTGGAHAASAAHARRYRELASSLEPAVTGVDGSSALDRLELEHDNLRAALRWTAAHEDPDVALGLVASLWRFWHLRGHIVEGRRWTAAVLESSSSASDRALADALIADGSLAYWQADYGAATARYADALEHARRTGDDRVIAEALFNLAVMLTSSGRIEEANDLIAEGARRFAAAGDERGRGRIAYAQGYAEALSGRLQEGRVRCDEAVRIFERAGDLYWEATSIHAAGQCLRLAGQAADAEPYFREALVRLARLQDRSGVAVELDMLAVVAAELADPVRSLRLAGAAAAIRDAIGAGQLLEIQVYRDPVEMVRGTVDDAELVDALSEGRSWSLAAALAYATDTDAGAHRPAPDATSGALRA